MMVRCQSCESTVITGETTCYACGAELRKTETVGIKISKRFALATKVAFLASAALTIASLFVDFTPSFVKCITTTLVLLFVNSSAQQMLEKKGG